MMSRMIVPFLTLFSIAVFVHKCDALHMLQKQHVIGVNRSIDIPLFIALHSINEASATALETKDATLTLVRDFCRAVQDQVRL